MKTTAWIWLERRFSKNALGLTFFLVQISGFLLLLAGELERMAVAWWCLERTNSAAVFASMVTVGSVGYLVAQPTLGWLGDRYPKRHVLLGSFGINALAGLLLATLSQVDEFSPWMVGGVLLVASLATSIVPALMSSVVVDLVSPSQVTDAFRVRSGFGSIASIGGPILAGTLVAFLGYKWVLLLACALVAAAFALLIAGIPAPDQIQRAQTAKGPRQFFIDWWRMTSYGARAVWAIKPELQMGVLAMVTNAAMLPLDLVLIPSLVKQHFSDPAWVSGMASASLGAGILVSSVSVLPRLKEWKSHDSQIILGRVLTASGVCGVLLAVVAFDLLLPGDAASALMFFSLFLSGIGLGIVSIVGSAVRSRAIPAHLRTRVFAATGFISGIGIPLGNLLQGAAFSTVGPVWSIAAVAAVMWLAIVIYLRSGEIRSLMQCQDSDIAGEYARRYPAFAVEHQP